MNEKELLLLRLEDMCESSDDKDVRVLAKALKRYFTSEDKKGIGFKDEV